MTTKQKVWAAVIGLVLLLTWFIGPMGNQSVEGISFPVDYFAPFFMVCGLAIAGYGLYELYQAYQLPKDAPRKTGLLKSGRLWAIGGALLAFVLYVFLRTGNA